MSATASTTGAALGWVKTALGGLFYAYLIQRLEPSGYLTIARIRDENLQTWTDTEARRNIAEAYRIMVQDTFGGLSQIAAFPSVTVPGLMMVVASNMLTSINRDVPLKFPMDVNVHEDSRLVAASGRYGQRFYRSTSLGQSINGTVFLRRENTVSLRGEAMWDDLLGDVRADVPYLALLSPFGKRKFVAADIDKIRWACNAEVDVPVQFPEVGNTPYAVDIS